MRIVSSRCSKCAVADDEWSIVNGQWSMLSSSGSALQASALPARPHLPLWLMGARYNYLLPTVLSCTADAKINQGSTMTTMTRIEGGVMSQSVVARIESNRIE